MANRYKYQDISELRSNLLHEIESYFISKGQEMQEEQYSNMLDNLLSVVEQETGV